MLLLIKVTLGRGASMVVDTSKTRPSLRLTEAISFCSGCISVADAFGADKRSSSVWFAAIGLLSIRLAMTCRHWPPPRADNSVFFGNAVPNQKRRTLWKKRQAQTNN